MKEIVLGSSREDREIVDKSYLPEKGGWTQMRNKRVEKRWGKLDLWWIKCHEIRMGVDKIKDWEARRNPI